jgi:hypothetical protein
VTASWQAESGAIPAREYPQRLGVPEAESGVPPSPAAMKRRKK